MRKIANIAFAAAIASCASTDYGVRSAGERPTDKSSAEAGFWFKMDQYETALKKSGRVVEDPVLQDFVETMTCDIAGDFCDELRVYIIDQPSFNASMSPNGMMLVHTGLLLRAADESELAAVIAHEFVHYEENHTMERYAAVRNANQSIGVLSALGIGGAMASLAVAGDTMGFVREHESQADIKGMDYMAAAGFNASSASAIWRNLRAELDASDDIDKQKRSSDRGFFNTHPVIDDRMAELDARAAAYPRADTNPEAYRAMIRPHLRAWLDAEAVKMDPGSTLQLLDRLSGVGPDLGVLHYIRGRVFSLRGREGDEAAAKAEFVSASAYPDAPPETFRALGNIHRESGDVGTAADAYASYLEAAPDARDAALIRKIISDLEGETS